MAVDCCPGVVRLFCAAILFNFAWGAFMLFHLGGIGFSRNGYCSALSFSCNDRSLAEYHAMDSVGDPIRWSFLFIFEAVRSRVFS